MELTELKATSVTPVSKEERASQALLERADQKVYEEVAVIQVHLEIRDLQAPRGHLEIQEPRAPRDQLVRRAHQDLVETRDSRDQLVLRDKLDSQDHKVVLDSKGILVPRASLAHSEVPDLVAHKGRLDLWGLLVPVDLQVIKATQDLQEILVHPVHQDLMVLLER